MKIKAAHSGSKQSRPSLAARCTALASIAAAASLLATPALGAPSAPAFARQALSSGSSGLSLASPYGQTNRFGGYDPTGSVPGRFDYPVGFAVDPSDSSTTDGNAVYVLDRVTDNIETGELRYRLQKLSSSGAVLGSVLLALQTYTDLENRSDAHPLISLAVDSSKHRVYALVESIVNGGLEEYVPVASKLIAWSTVPNERSELVRAPGYPEDPSTHASLVAGPSVLQPAEPSSDLYAPEGLAVDPSDHDVVIEAQQGVTDGLKGGPTILQRVATEGGNSGLLDGNWVASSTIAPQGEAPDGLFTATDGSFGIDLYQDQGKISRLADVKPNFGTPEASLLAPDASGGLNRDEAPTIDDEYTVNYRFASDNGLTSLGALSAYTAGSPITQLSNGLYAARFGQAFDETDPQSLISPWNGVPFFWLQKKGEEDEVANMGVRLFSSNGAVVTTIGGQAQGQACNLDYARFAVAAGSNGSVFVLTQPNRENGDSDDEVIEFTPGGKGACPQPSGSLTVNGKAGSSFSFPVGTNVTLADSVERKGEAPFRFDWVLLSKSNASVEDLKTQIEAPSYTWPAPETSHTFTKKGTYYVAATVYGDYGLTYITTDTITIH